MHHFRLITLLLSLLALAAHGGIKVSLLTCMQGDDIYELEGHSGLRIWNDSLPFDDMTVNWGVFDFNAPNFVYRFVKGETDYRVASEPTDIFLESYRREGRGVFEQELNLTPAETGRLIELLLYYLHPRNCVYRYNYVLDNCATRPLRMLEWAIGDTLTLAAPDVPHSERSTFRQAMRHYHADYPWYQFGIDLALGSGIDRRISEREASFAPVMLVQMIAEARRPDGEPLVTASRWLQGTPATASAALGPTPVALTPLFWAWTVFALAFTVTILQARGIVRWARWFDTVWCSLCFLAGLVLTFLIFVSVHEATSPNWLYLWLNPLCIIGAVAPWLKKGKRLEFWYQSVNFALILALAVIFIGGVQNPNPAFIPLLAASALRAAAGFWFSRPSINHKP